MSQIKFSIITPSFNRAYCLWKSIQSVLKQTYPFFELIIVDDASTDDTEKLLKEFTDPRIKYIKNKENLGASASRNIGLENANNEYIAYIDSDNIWHDDFLETYVKAIKSNTDKKVFYAKKNYRLHIIDEDGQEKTLRDENTNSKLYFDLKRLFHRKILIDTNTLVHKKDILEQTGKWDEELDFWEDWELTLRIADKFGDVFYPINRVLINYEQTLNFEDKEKVVEKWENAEKYIFEKYKNNKNLEGQKWFPSKNSERSTLSIVEFLRSKKN
jgi:glycosyltransferase involved in cell wall biosynthesis